MRIAEIWGGRWRCFFLLLAFALHAPVGHANPLKDAWDCASGVVEANYELASKGAKAAEVIGSAPQCVALATTGDPPLLVLTGAMFAVNAVSPATLPAESCTAALKSTAAMPIAKVLDGVFSGIIPGKYLDAANGEAQGQLWDFLSTTPPIDQVAGRAGCGCTFLEAGISVENLKEMLAVIGSAGKKCDKFLDNIPGYSPAKSAVNNLAEDLFTDQVTHKPVDAYYRQDFGGCENCWEKQSHAMAKAIDPAHDWASQSGAGVLYGTYVGGNTNGAPPGNVMKTSCKVYFDGHKMSASNAEKVCSTLVQQFETDYQAFVPVFKARDQLVKQLPATLQPITQYGEQQCAMLYANAPSFTRENSILNCKDDMRKMRGSLGYPDPFDGSTVGSLGTPVGYDTIQGWLKGTTQYYFMEPLSMSGASASAYQSLQSNGFNVAQALKMAQSAYQSGVDEVIRGRKEKAAKEAKAKEAAIVAQFNTEVGGFWSGKCPDAFKPMCTARLRQAWEQCNTQLDKIPYDQGPNQEFKTQDPKKVESVKKQCQSGYATLTMAFQQFSNKLKQLDSQLAFQCPQAAGEGLQKAVTAQCRSDLGKVKNRCVGGTPMVTGAFFLNGKVTQSPAPLGDCSGVADFFAHKWGMDETLQADINGAYSTAVIACIAIGLPGCQEVVSAKADVCRAKIAKEAVEGVGVVAIDSPDLDKAVNKLVVLGSNCKEDVLRVPDKFAKGKEAEVLALKIYGPQCPPRSAKGDFAGQCRNALLETVQASMALP